MQCSSKLILIILYAITVHKIIDLYLLKCCRIPQLNPTWQSVLCDSPAQQRL